jgi:hypothetical protein
VIREPANKRLRLLYFFTSFSFSFFWGGDGRVVVTAFAKGFDSTPPSDYKRLLAGARK